MYYLFKLIDNFNGFLRIKFKILGWKIKYGKRIKIGKNLRFRKNMVINISKQGYLEIGDNNGFNNYCSINCHKYIKIGDNNMFGECVKIYDHNHVFNDKKVDMQRTYKDSEIIIGSYNWFATNCSILSKARVGDYNVFANGLVVNSEFDSENLVRNDNNYIIEKIKYKDDKND